MEKNNSFENRKLLYIIIVIIVMISLIYIGRAAIVDQGINSNEINNQQGKINSEEKSQEENMSKQEGNPIVTIRMAGGGEIKLELYPEEAPNTVRNFISLVEKDFYDGLIFHRVIEGFMIQGGDPEGTGIGGPGYSIKGEFKINNFDNDIKHSRGVISMARSGHPDSAGSQFFIMHKDSSHLDGQYAAFGKVIEGMDVVDKIATVKTGANDRPDEEQVMEEVSVETFGIEYEEPERIER